MTMLFREGDGVSGPRDGWSAARSVPVALVTSLLLAGCASSGSTLWRIEPVYQVQGAGSVAGAGPAAVEAVPADLLSPAQRTDRPRPRDATTYHERGLALVQDGRLEEALASMRQAVALAPKNARLHNNLGYVLASLGQIEPARAAFRHATELDPEYEAASNNLAWLTVKHPPERPQAVAAAAAADRGEARMRPISLRQLPDLAPVEMPVAASHATSPLPRAMAVARSGMAGSARNIATSAAPSRHAVVRKTRSASPTATSYTPTYLERQYWRWLDSRG